MPEAVFVTDLHGGNKRYISLFEYIADNPPDILLLGGDLLAPFMPASAPGLPAEGDFINGFLRKHFAELRDSLGDKYPDTFLIMGNDDPRLFESALIDGGHGGLWTYIHHRKKDIYGCSIYGYNYVPPTPFILKDWERYDVSRFTDVGCISPEEGSLSFPVSEQERKWTTIKEDLEIMTEGESLENAVFLFHAPPYNTLLDLGDVGNAIIDYVPVDEHLGSIAVQRFIEERQPLLTLHGHVHEASSLSGSWMQKIGRTVCINGAYEGVELSLVRIPLECPEKAVRMLI